MSKVIKKYVWHTCPVCKKKFQDLNLAKSKTCSLSCGSILAWRKIERKPKDPCQVCGTPVSRKGHKTCSYSCGAKLRNKIHGNNRWKNRHSNTKAASRFSTLPEVGRKSGTTL